MMKLDVRDFAPLLVAALLILILNMEAGKGQRISRRCSSYIRYIVARAMMKLYRHSYIAIVNMYI